MVQQFKVPETESELRQLQDKLYSITKEQTETGAFRGFRGLLEIMASETVIMTAIHNIKANKGAETAGTDGRTMRADILQQDYTQIVAKVQRSFQNYRPMSVRRKWIPKPGKSEKRPLGIPAIMDRIIQECVRIVLEPIMEAQFFKHSYGFRPWRDAHMALERVKDQVSRVGYYWIVEGDISKFFDNVNHTILIKKLWHMGVRDQRVLMIIKAMLKAGIMGEISENPLGTPQGGIISPLLANVYLHSMDEWITREWENKKTRTTYSSSRNQYQSLHRYSNLKPAYLVRYADDWILLTNSRENANRWKSRIANYLKVNLRLELSMEKTLVTNIKRKPIHFLGFTYKVTRGGTAMRGYKPVVKPQADRLNRKMEEVLKDISFLQRSMDKAESVDRINRINAKIRGLINYYSVANHVNLEMDERRARAQHFEDGDHAARVVKFHGMVVEADFEAARVCGVGGRIEEGEKALPAVGGGDGVAADPRHDEAAAPELRIGVERLVEGIRQEQFAPDVRAFHPQTVIREHLLPFRGGMVVQTGQFYAIIAHFRKGTKGSGKVCLAVFVDGVELYGNRCFHG